MATEDPDDTVRLEARGSALYVVVVGDLDVVVAHRPYELVHDYLGDHDGVSSVVIDLTASSFLDSTGLGGLIRTQQEAGRHGTPVTLRGVGQRLRRLLEMTGLDNEFRFE